MAHGRHKTALQRFPSDSTTRKRQINLLRSAIDELQLQPLLIPGANLDPPLVSLIRFCEHHVKRARKVSNSNHQIPSPCCIETDVSNPLCLTFFSSAVSQISTCNNVQTGAYKMKAECDQVKNRDRHVTASNPHALSKKDCVDQEADSSIPTPCDRMSDRDRGQRIRSASPAGGGRSLRRMHWPHLRMRVAPLTPISRRRTARCRQLAERKSSRTSVFPFPSGYMI